MGIKPDAWIRRMARDQKMIDPFEESQVREGVISYGLSSYGYDIRVADEFKIFTNINTTIVDPKDFSRQSFVDFQGPICIIPPNSFALARTVEYFRIPRSILTICVGKSTYARCGIIVNVTPFEPEWEGHATLEIPNPQQAFEPNEVVLTDSILGKPLGVALDAFGALGVAELVVFRTVQRHFAKRVLKRPRAQRVDVGWRS